MLTLVTLIDEAALVCGGQAALARRINVHRSELSEIRSGRRPLTPELVGLLADVLELSAEDARRLAAEAVVQNPKNAGRAGVLRRAFFVSLAVGAASVPLIAGIDRDNFTLSAAVTLLTLYTLSSATGRGFRLTW